MLRGELVSGSAVSVGFLTNSGSLPKQSLATKRLTDFSPAKLECLLSARQRSLPTSVNRVWQHDPS